MALLTGSVLMDWVALLVGVLMVAYFVRKRKLDYWKNLGVPYVEPNLIFGNCRKLFFLQQAPGQFLEHLHNHSPEKPYVGFYIFSRPALLVKDADVLKKILIKDFNYFMDRHANTNEKDDPIGANILFGLNGMKWKHLRAKLTPTFTSGKMKQMFELIAECSEELRGHLRCNTGRTEDVREVLANYTTDVITSCAFGINTYSIKNPNSEFRKFGKMVFEFSNYRAFEFMSIFFLPAVVKLARLQFLTKEAAAFLQQVFWETLTLREKSNIKRNDMIEILRQLNSVSNDLDDGTKNSSSGLVFTRQELLAQAAQFFAAGFETTASTISFALYELAMNPHTQKRLREEIADALRDNDGKISYDMIHKMKYLDMVVSETLRKYPPLGFLDRVTMQDYQLPGTNLTIKKGTPIFVSLSAIQNSARNFEDPRRFDPERFNEDNKKSIETLAYMPFGEGPRNCVGSRFGLMTSKTGLVYFLSEFEAHPCKGTPQQIRFHNKALLTSSDRGIPLNIVSSKVY